MWMAKVHVTLKPVVLDPQGQAVLGGLKSLGFDTVQSVRAGKYMEIKLDAPDRAEAERLVKEMCAKLLANPVIEDYRLEVAPIEG
jgi:phosphoribosylformylglycinamidine synthase subunit PurS